MKEIPFYFLFRDLVETSGIPTTRSFYRRVLPAPTGDNGPEFGHWSSPKQEVSVEEQRSGGVSNDLLGLGPGSHVSCGMYVRTLMRPFSLDCTKFVTHGLELYMYIEIKVGWWWDVGGW